MTEQAQSAVRDRRHSRPASRQGRARRSATLRVEACEARVLLANLSMTFTVPGAVANKGVYAGVFGQLLNGTTGYTNVPAYTPGIGPSAGTPINGGSWVYLTTNVVGSTTVGASTSLAQTLMPVPPNTATTIVVAQGGTAAFPSTGGKLLISGPGQKATMSYTGTTSNSFTGAKFIEPPQGMEFIASNGITVSEERVPLDASTITVASTNMFTSSGYLMVEGDGFNQVLTYTGTTPTSFTGVSGGSGAVPAGTRVIAPPVLPGGTDYALTPKGQHLPLISLFPLTGTYPNSNQTVSATITIPDQAAAPITSGQVVISVGSAMVLPVDPTAGSIASPDVGTNPNDKFGLFEWGWNSSAGVTPTGVLDIDVSEVDQVGFPFTATTSPAMPPPAQDGTGMHLTRDVLFNSFSPYLRSLDPASKALVFEAGSPHNTQTTFPTGTRITAPQDVVTKLEAQPAVPVGTITQGGSLTVGTNYYYAYTAVSASGESMASSVLTLLPFKGSSNGKDVYMQTANLSWAPYAYAQSYKVYRALGVNNGQLVNPVFLKSVAASGPLVYVDDGSNSGTNATPPTNNYEYDLLNQYFTSAIKDFFDYYQDNDFVLDMGGADKTTFKGRTTTITVGANSYRVLQLAGQAGQYGGLYAGNAASIYEPFFSSNTNQNVPGVTNYPAPPSWLVSPSESPSAMVFGCDGVFDTPSTTVLPTAALATLTLGGNTLGVVAGGTAGFAPTGSLLIAGPGNTTQVVTYTGIDAGTNTFTGVTGGTGTFTSATVIGLTATSTSQGAAAPGATVKDIMNSIASAFNRGLTPRQTSTSAWTNVLPPSYWASDPNPLTAAATTNTNGSLPAGKYRYVMTAVNINGGFTDSATSETTPSNEVEVHVSGANNAVNLTWPAINMTNGPSGAMTAASFNIYRSTYDATSMTWGPLLRIKQGLVNGPTVPTTSFLDTDPSYPANAPSPPFVYYADGSTANFYAGFLHQREVSINGLAYGFPYDDQGGFSTNVQMPTPNSVTITLVPWTNAAALTVTGPSTPPSAGSATSITVTAVDGSGNVVTDYAGTVYFSSTDTKAVLPGAYTFQPSDNGTRVFSVTFKTAGAQMVTVTDTANDFVESASVNVQPGAPSALVFTRQPEFTMRGESQPITVEALDAYGNRATNAQGNVTLAGLKANLTARLVRGVATFRITPERIGQFRLRAVAAFATAASRAFAVANARWLVITGPKQVQAGVPFDIAITARRLTGVVDRFHERPIDVFFRGRRVATTMTEGGVARARITLEQPGLARLVARDRTRGTLLGFRTFMVAASS